MARMASPAVSAVCGEDKREREVERERGRGGCKGARGAGAGAATASSFFVRGRGRRARPGAPGRPPDRPATCRPPHPRRSGALPEQGKHPCAHARKEEAFVLTARRPPSAARVRSPSLCPHAPARILAKFMVAKGRSVWTISPSLCVRLPAMGRASGAVWERKAGVEGRGPHSAVNKIRKRLSLSVSRLPSPWRTLSWRRPPSVGPGPSSGRAGAGRPC